MTHLSGVTEFALLRAGVLVERGRRTPTGRVVRYFRPTEAKAMPGAAEAIGRRFNPATDVEVETVRKGVRQVDVQSLKAPVAQRGSAETVGALRKLKSALLPHWDRRGVVATTHASSYDAGTIGTRKLVEHYKRAGFKPDLSEMRRNTQAMPAARRQIRRMYTQDFVPMIRQPRTP